MSSFQKRRRWASSPAASASPSRPSCGGQRPDGRRTSKWGLDLLLGRNKASTLAYLLCSSRILSKTMVVRDDLAIKSRVVRLLGSMNIRWYSTGSWFANMSSCPSNIPQATRVFVSKRGYHPQWKDNLINAHGILSLLIIEPHSNLHLSLCKNSNVLAIVFNRWK